MHGNCRIPTFMKSIHTKIKAISSMHMRLSEARSTHIIKKRVCPIHVEFYIYVAESTVMDVLRQDMVACWAKGLAAARKQD